MLLRKTAISFLFLFLIRFTFAQYDFLDDVPNWLGVWEGSYTVDDWNNKETVSIKWIHNKHWLEFDISGQTNDDPKMVYSESMFLTADFDMNIVGFYIDDNGYNYMATIKGKTEGTKLILDAKSPSMSWQITWEHKEGKLYRTTTLDKKSTVQAVFTKKQ